MRSLEDSSARWAATIQQASSLEDLKLAVRLPGDRSPCISGLCSVCWKNVDVLNWSTVTNDSRQAYKSLRDHFLKYIEHPEELGSALDPLDDSKSSPWNTLRQDEELRAEIFQDVERCMQDEPYFRQTGTQQAMLDILFIFCKLNQDVGYRQGMHELLAPILLVIESDSINVLDQVGNDGSSHDELMLETLDSRYVEHDAFTVFSLLMQSAKTFYELGEPNRRLSTSVGNPSLQNGSASIVERSKRIHEDLLAQVDPDLATHLTAVEILPQIFLIRWIRLLFGREFPFDQLLLLWTILFAEDPALDLVDLICVAMLLRIRWQLMDADYSVSLSILLKYPVPIAPNGPQTFVEDAIYLKKNLNREGGAFLISKYSGRGPAMSSSSSRPMTPVGKSISGRALSPEKASSRRSQLPSPARFLQQQGGVEAILQGAAKTVYERGERLGINKAVRDAVVEVKKNLQTVSPSGSIRGNEGTRWSLDEGRTVSATRRSTPAMEQRNKLLARMLQEALDEFRKVQLSDAGDGREGVSEIMDLAIAKVQFVQVYLDDSTMPLPAESLEPGVSQIGSQPNTNQIDSAASPQKLTDEQGSPKMKVTQAVINSPATNNTADKPRPRSGPDQTDEVGNSQVLNTPNTPSMLTETPVHAMKVPDRPVVVPTRSSLAQSSFAWMLEPNDAVSSNISPPSSKSSPFSSSGKTQRSGPNREKTAFLFGEEPDDILDPVQTNGPKKTSTQTQDEAGFVLGTMRGKKPA